MDGVPHNGNVVYCIICWIVKIQQELICKPHAVPGQGALITKEEPPVLAGAIYGRCILTPLPGSASQHPWL